MDIATPTVIRTEEGESLGLLGSLMVPGAATRGAFAIVEHVIPPGIMLAVPHTHSREDEVSFVISGEIGGLVGDRPFRAPRGSYVLKPRGVSHAVWNPGPEVARIQEIITPAGFESFFAELNALLTSVTPDEAMAEVPVLGARYGLTYQLEGLPRLMEEYGVTLPG
jgi:mannose-6-phosphate isomerase-like protein (cupin superfamily)